MQLLLLDGHPWNLNNSSSASSMKMTKPKKLSTLAMLTFKKRIFKGNYLFRRYWDTDSLATWPSLEPPEYQYLDKHVSMQTKVISFEDIEMLILVTWRTPLLTINILTNIHLCRGKFKVISLSMILRCSLLLLDGHPWNLLLTINIFNKHISMQRTGISFKDIEMHTIANWRPQHFFTVQF